MILVMNFIAITRRGIVLLCTVGGNLVFLIVAAGNLRTSGEAKNRLRLSTTMERVLPCSPSALQSVQSELESFEARRRHHSDPREHNIFVHHVMTPTFPSELPSILPSIANASNDGDETSSAPTRIPSVEPSLSMMPTVRPSMNISFSPTSHPSSAPILISRPTNSPTDMPTKTFSPTVTYSPTISYADDDIALGTYVPTPNTNSNNDDNEPSEPTYNFTAASIDDFLYQTLSDSGVIYDIGSPQNDALSVTLNSSTPLDPNDPNDQIQILQRYALSTLYFSTDGTNWESKDFWTSASNPCGIKNENNETEDAWFGIICDSEQKVVEKISLNSNALRGAIPSEIRGLSSLKRLEISNNQLSGSIHDAIGELKDLSVLNVGINFFTGSIPSSIGNLKSLMLLDISANFLSGTLMTEIAQLTTLLSLSASSNFLEGRLITELFTITPLSK